MDLRLGNRVGEKMASQQRGGGAVKMSAMEELEEAVTSAWESGVPASVILDAVRRQCAELETQEG